MLSYTNTKRDIKRAGKSQAQILIALKLFLNFSTYFERFNPSCGQSQYIKG